jgi:hypothetical protein
MRRVASILISLAMMPVAFGVTVSSEFSEPAMTFKVTVSNPDTVMRLVTGIGVRSRASGSFGCLNNATGLISLADYPLSFAVDQPETLIKADPRISLPPGSSAFFSVSLYPNAAGACGPWSSVVSVIIVFDDGTRLETESRTIDAARVEAKRTRNPERDEVLQSLSHRNVDLRLQGLRQLGKAGVDNLTLETKVRLAFEDPDRRVRSEAYRQAAALRLQRLAPDLIGRFARIPIPREPEPVRQASSTELFELCKAFTAIRAVGAEDGLLAAVTNPNFVHAEAVSDLLRKIRTPDMPGKLMRAVEHQRGVTPSNDVLLKTLISYRDPRSVPLLKSRLRNKQTAYVVLSNVLAQTEASRRVQDPFVLAFEAPARKFLTDSWGNDRQNLREPAMLLAVRASDDAAVQTPLLQAGLRDRSRYVQLAAAKEAAALGLTSIAPEIRARYVQSEEPFRPHFCNALTALRATCGESP